MNKRWIAYKLNVNDVANGNYTDDGFIDLNSVPINRVRLMGTVVQRFIGGDDKYGFFILDDGTETIRIRSFQDSIGLIKDTNIGDIVDVFGRIRQYEGEIYVIPEIVRKTDDPNLWILRKLELKRQKLFGSEKKPKTEEKKEGAKPVIETETVVIEEEIIEEVIDKPKVTKDQTKLEEVSASPRKKVVDCIIEHDNGEGVEVDRLLEKCGLDDNVVENILTDLMNEGEIFEPRAGKVKILG